MKDIDYFDTRGLWFVIKFISIILIVITVAQYGSGIFFSTAMSKESDVRLNGVEEEFKKLTERRRKILLAQDALTRNAFREEKIDIVTLGFVGDIMLDRGIERVIMETGNGDFSFPFTLLKNNLKKYDVLFGNLEGPVSDKGSDAGSIYSFRMDPKTIPALKSAGFDILSVANNHAGDWGVAAMRDTYKRLGDAGIVYSGGGITKEQAYAPQIIEVEDLKIAYVSFSQFGKGYMEATSRNPGIAIISNTKLKKSIQEARKKSDLVVVSFHYGDEYKKEPNSYQKKVSKNAIKYGADLVIGHHPHVVEPVVKYKDGYIAYSLGNFIFDQNFPEDGSDSGLILEVIIKNKKIDEVNGIEIKFNDFFQPFVE